jgi:mechanosensitive ion channel-like protein
METFATLVLEQLSDVYYRFAKFCPNILVMLTIILVGILAAKIIRYILLKLLGALQFDSWSDRMGLTSIMRKGNLWHKPSLAVGSFVYWFLIIGVLMAGFSALNFQAMDNLITRFILFGPRMLSAILILVFGYIATGFIGRAVLIGAVNRGHLFARPLADTVRVLLTALFVAMALEQLEVAPAIVVTAFSIIFGGTVLTLAISFGVGGIDAARKIIEKEMGKKDEEKKDINHI